jgi:hypothetical protein
VHRVQKTLRQLGRDLPPGSAPIAAGLAILAAAILSPGVPAVTGMALVALGATIATTRRFRSPATIVPAMMLHLATYGSLYALFLGATLHAATQSGSRLSIFNILDLALSICPLAVALERVWSELNAGQSCR